MTPAEYQRCVGRDERDVQVREALIMMRLLNSGMPWIKARDAARELVKNEVRNENHTAWK